MADAPAEFQLIGRHFRPLAGPGALDLSDDCAVFAPPSGREMVVAADAMVQGLHFLPDQDPGLVGRKLLRVNLSDLAAMGATPLGYLLTVSLPRATPGATPDAWLAGFAAGLAEDQRQFGVHLLGGDTTGTDGPIVLSLTILGHVAPGKGVRRSGARAGDGLWVTGTVGDGVLGLAAARGELPDHDGYLAGRYRLPTPRLALPIGGLAHAAIDVSDGLVQEVGHLTRASGVAADIEAALIPLSPQARRAGAALGTPRWMDCVSGGDDYELVLAVPPGREARLQQAAERIGVPVTRIGSFRHGPPDVTLRDAQGEPIVLTRGGWSHF